MTDEKPPKRAQKRWTRIGARCCGIAAIGMLLALPGARGTSAASGSVFTSQLGFALGDSMTAVLAVPTGTPVQSSFQVLSEATGASVYASQPTDVLPYQGGWVGNDTRGDTYLLDFTTAALSAGAYTISSNGATSLPFEVGASVYDVARYRPLEFFRIQASGVAGSWISLDGSTGGHSADHLDDARQATRRDKGGGDRNLIQQDELQLPGGRLDVAGGWSDAGDYNKYMGNTPWAAYLLLLTYEDRNNYWSPVDDDHNGVADLREVVRPAIEWMLKMQHSDGSMYERVFNGYAAGFDGRPDGETDNVSGTSDDRPLDTDRYADITAKSSYALAAAYRVFGDERYLDAAVRTWDWANANPGRVKPKVYGGGLYFGDLEVGLTLGAIEIHRAQLAAGLVPDPRFLTYATARVRDHLTAGDWVNPSSWDYQHSYALIRYFDLASPAEQTRIVDLLKARWDAGIQTQFANAYRMNDEWLYGDFGQNENSTSSAGDALWVFSKTNDRKYYDYAVHQMAWVFGRNPFGESWLSSANVREYTRVPHWRGTAKHAIEGVVVPGAADRNGNNIPDYTDSGDWFYSEPTINQQAMFLRVMTELHFAAGGAAPPPADPSPILSIVAPQQGATVSGVIAVEASASDVGGATAVSFRTGSGATVPMTLVSGDAQAGVWQAQLNTTLVSDGQHAITLEATDTLGQTSASFVTVNVRNSAQPSLHVERIDAVLISKGTNRVQARCDVYVHDAFGIRVTSATVAGHWYGAANDSFTLATDSAGKATDYSNSLTRVSGLAFNCVVDSVSKSGWVYNAAANKATMGTVTVP